MPHLDGFVSDDELAVAPLRDLGWEVAFVPWRQPAAVWDAFDAAVIRTTWDYQRYPDEFLNALAAIEARGVPLANPLALVGWNVRKSYLADLAARGIAIPPTVWRDGLDAADEPAPLFDALQTEEIVLKPLISANADHTYRLRTDTAAALWPPLRGVFARRPWLAQTFQPAIIEEGEYSLIYLGGELSHAILKRPKAGDFRSQEEHGSTITLVAPEAGLQELGRQALRALPAAPLYARLDAVRGARGDFLVMELELIEPALYFRMHPPSAARFAAALVGWVEGCGR